ncbi:MAG: hypothetical protein AB9872_15175 [Solidesulfovibrio sp.]
MYVMKRTHLLEYIGEDHRYPDLNQAPCAAQKNSRHALGESAGHIPAYAFCPALKREC